MRTSQSIKQKKKKKNINVKGASSPLGVHFVMSLLSLAEDADGIVRLTPTARIASVTLHRVSASERADAG